MGLSAWQTAFAVMLVVCGFVVYYIIPYSFIFLNMGLFLSILNGILLGKSIRFRSFPCCRMIVFDIFYTTPLGMVAGAAIIATLLQPSLELKVLWFLVWGRDRNLYILVGNIFFCSVTFPPLTVLFLSFDSILLYAQLIVSVFCFLWWRNSDQHKTM